MTARDGAADKPVTLDVNILGRDYKVACKESERAELTAAVAYLDHKMREIRGAGKVVGADRIAVMAALNITHEMLREHSAAAAAPLPMVTAGGVAGDGVVAASRIRAMGSAIDQLLANQEKLF